MSEDQRAGRIFGRCSWSRSSRRSSRSPSSVDPGHSRIHLEGVPRNLLRRLGVQVGLRDPHAGRASSCRDL